MLESSLPSRRRQFQSTLSPLQLRNNNAPPPLPLHPFFPPSPSPPPHVLDRIRLPLPLPFPSLSSFLFPLQFRRRTNRELESFSSFLIAVGPTNIRTGGKIKQHSSSSIGREWVGRRKGGFKKNFALFQLSPISNDAKRKKRERRGGQF